MGGVASVVDDARLLSDPHDESGLAENVRSLLTDSEFATGVARHARDRAAKLFSLERLVADCDRTYRALLKAHPDPMTEARRSIGIELLKRTRASRVVNAPLTHGVRAVAHTLGVTPEFAIKHLPHTGATHMKLPGNRHAVLWSRGDDWISNQVFWRGWNGYEPETTPMFWRLASSADVVLDIGAHVGFYSVLAAQANPNARVIALEPLPVVFERLRRNLDLNGLTRVEALQLAAGATDGESEFYYVPGAIPSSSSLSGDFMKSSDHTVTSLQVSVVRLDSLLEIAGVGKVDLVKLDTETTEPDVLVGLGAFLSEWRPDLLCEVLGTADVAALTSILTPLGYTFYLLTDDGPERRDHIAPDPKWLNYLFTARTPPASQAEPSAASVGTG